MYSTLKSGESQKSKRMNHPDEGWLEKKLENLQMYLFLIKIAKQIKDE